MDFDKSHNKLDDDVPFGMSVRYFVRLVGTEWSYYKKKPTQNIRTTQQNKLNEKFDVNGEPNIQLMGDRLKYHLTFELYYIDYGY